MPIWNEILSDRDRRVIEGSVYSARRGLGSRPVVFVVDAQEHFLGTKEDVLESVKVYPKSMGKESWDALEHIAQLIKTARKLGIPVMYSKSGTKAGEEQFDSFARKRKATSDTSGVASLDIPIVAEVAPLPGEVVIEKRYPSAFFGTSLMSFLHSMKCDTLILVGYTTSGCLRATCVDAMSYNFNVGVVGEACADRMHLSHRASLMDMNMKYADVISMDEAEAYLAASAERAAQK